MMLYDNPDIQPPDWFNSDGCTLSPDGDWVGYCLIHDWLYDKSSDHLNILKHDADYGLALKMDEHLDSEGIGKCIMIVLNKYGKYFWKKTEQKEGEGLPAKSWVLMFFKKIAGKLIMRKYRKKTR